MSDALTKVTVNLPKEALARAATIIEGLEELERRAHRSALRALRGRIRIDLNLPETRR